MELGGDVIDESDGVGLGMAIEDSQSPNAGRIVNRRVLIALDGIAVFSLEGQELDVDLDLMSGDFLFIAGVLRLASIRLMLRKLCNQT